MFYVLLEFIGWKKYNGLNEMILNCLIMLSVFLMFLDVVFLWMKSMLRFGLVWLMFLFFRIN